ncbi:MAG: hypothetical protein KGK03_01870 [Candidatus Omnitrophica bacterium]|nr:hypothetical protein [Candidatus Omnitrophota bacterium]MDE2221796.1 hypothetical protein [Candidatus Omnitrophota bacterium]
MDWPLPKYKLLAVPHLLIFFIFLPSLCFAGEIDADLFGLTYHLHRKGAVYNAPLKLDKAGVKVFNPGLGLGYDFRKNRHTDGFSVIVHGGLFENCDNHPYAFIGAGGRYRRYFNKTTFVEANLLGALTYGNDSDDKHYKLNPTPYANIGIGHDYGKFSVTYYISYIPKGSDGGITSSTDMLFFSTEVSF